jgi:hypothetical protein
VIEQHYVDIGSLQSALLADRAGTPIVLNVCVMFQYMAMGCKTEQASVSIEVKPIKI